MHKQGVDALCLLTGPFGGALFNVFDEHREQDANWCETLVDELLDSLDHTKSNTTLVLHLLNTHPGRIGYVRERLTEWLDQ